MTRNFQRVKAYIGYQLNIFGVNKKMTHFTKAIRTKVRINERITVTAAFSVFVLCLVFSISVFFSEVIAEAIRTTLPLLTRVIIPSIFPFIILSDFLTAYVDFSSIKFINKLFEKIFKINGAATVAFIIGNLCGFPLGVRCAAKLYSSGKITKEECERLIGFANNTGPAFLISGIGAGMYGNLNLGLCLYFSMILSSLVVGIIFSLSKSPSDTNSNFTLSNPHLDITESIRSAGLNTLSICSYILAFSCVGAVISKITGGGPVYLFTIPFIEIGSSTAILATYGTGSVLTLFLTGFAVGFSGLCVHFQAKSFLAGTDIKMKKYIIMKLIQGILCGMLLLISAFVPLF